VQFKLDGANLGSEDTSSPYSISWDTTKSPNAQHTLTAVARDAAGNSTSTQRSVTVSNSTSVDPGPTTPGPIAGQGYSNVFDDEFNSLDTNTWRLGNWYTPESPANYSVSNGILSIFNHPSERTQRDLMTRSKAWQYGYFEMRAKYTRNVDAWASIWMLSDNWIRTGNCTTLKISEFDILEAFHNLESPTTFRSHSGTIHRNTSGYCGMADSARSGWTNDVGFELGDNWHVYSGLWTPTDCSVYVDGQLLKTWPVWDTTNQPMRLFLGMWSHNYAAEDRLDVDWVRVWQK